MDLSSYTQRIAELRHQMRKLQSHDPDPAPSRETASLLIEIDMLLGELKETVETTSGRQVRHAALRAEVSTALALPHDEPHMLQQCVEAIVRHLGAAFARIWTLPPGGTVLELRASAGRYTHIDGGHARVPVGQLKIGRIAQRRQPYLTNDVPSDPEIGDPAWAIREGMVAFAGYPLLVEGRLVGVMGLFAHAPLAGTTLDALAAIAGMIAQGIDRKRVEQERRSSEALFRLVFERSPDAMFLMDPHDPVVPWRILDCNEVACRMNGYARDELVGQSLHVLDPGTTSWVDDRTFLDRIRREGTIHGVSPHRRKDGSIFFIEFSTSLLTIDGREQALGIDRDLTERLQAEEALRRANEDLESRVEQRTAELARAAEQLRGELARREAADRRFAAQYAVSRILADAQDFAEAGPRMLQVIAESQDWQVAQLWLVDDAAGIIHWSAIWHAPTITAATFEQASRNTCFTPGEGLPGEVWARGTPMWIDDLANGHNFPRLHTAATAGLRSGFAFPIRSNDTVAAVMEFFSTETRPHDETHLQMVALIANQSGQFIERRRAEQAVRFQAHLLDTVEQAVLATDLQGTIIYWNRFAETLFGWSAADALGRNVLEVTPDASSQSESRAIMERLHGGQSWSGEILARRRDGTVVPLLVTDAPVYDAEGALIGIVGISIDITERKRAEEHARFLAEAGAALASSLDEQEILETLTRLAVPPFADACVVELHTTKPAVARLAAHIDPARIASLAEAHLRAAHDPEPASPFARILRGEAFLLTEVPDTMLVTMARDAEHLALLRELDVCSWIGVPLSARERLLGMITFTTILERRYDTADLRLAEELARRAALAVDNARLYREAQEAIRARDTFLSIASHELRTPLTGMLGYLQLLESRMGREPRLTERAIRIAREQGHRLELLVGEMLDISRLERGLFHVNREPLDFAALVERIVEQMEPTLQSHTLTLSIPDGAVPILGDESGLEQVVQNLLTNAVKYSPAGGAISVQVERRNGQAYLEVSDQGLGIAAAEHEHLFQRFYRAGNARRARISGFGLGLYLVNEIVSRHDGTVGVRSVEGHGSTFTVCIPLEPDV